MLCMNLARYESTILQMSAAVMIIFLLSLLILSFRVLCICEYFQINEIHRMSDTKMLIAFQIRCSPTVWNRHWARQNEMIYYKDKSVGINKCGVGGMFWGWNWGLGRGFCRSTNSPPTKKEKKKRKLTEQTSCEPGNIVINVF